MVDVTAKPSTDRRAVAERHLPIIEALRLRDPDRIDAAFRAHFEAAAAILAQVWPEGDGADDAVD